MAGRTWARIDVSYLSHPKIRSVSERAVLLHLASILWLHAHGIDDGHLPTYALDHLHVTMRKRKLDGLIGELTAANLWHTSYDPPGFVVHGFADYAAPQTGNAARQRKYRKLHAIKGSGDA